MRARRIKQLIVKNNARMHGRKRSAVKEKNLDGTEQRAGYMKNAEGRMPQ
jgi:hypothetical protein